MKSVKTCVLVAVMLTAQPGVQAVDFGERTPSVNELADALAPPRVRRGAVGIAGASALSQGRASMQIGFDFGSSKVMDRDLDKLQNLAHALNRDDLQGVRYKVIGHTDAVGPLATNMRLSRLRAESVTAHLIRHGIDPARLAADGRGPNELLRQDRPDAAENRRVEIRVQP